MTGRQVLLYLANKYNNNWDKIFNDIKTKAPINKKEAESLENPQAITILDNNYPEELKRVCRPPFVLYYEGDVGLLNTGFESFVYLVGSNYFSIPEENLVTIKDNKICIGKNLKVWSDTRTHSIYHNNIVSAFAKAFVLTKTIHKPILKINVTIDSFLNLHKDVYCTPTYNKSYNNTLIKEGVYLIDSLEDIKDIIMPSKKEDNNEAQEK